MLTGPTEPELLSAEQLAAFISRGYVVLPSFLPADSLQILTLEVDRWIDAGLRAASISCCTEPSSDQPPATMELELGGHGWLVSYPPLMAVLEQLMGPVFAFHHMHSSRHDPGLAGKEWHHDYEQHPQARRSHVMVHVFHYLSGLDGTVGNLVLLPRSHRVIAAKEALNEAGTAPLHGEVVIDDLPPGSTVVVHSALFHARRPRPCEDGHSRYFVDAAYCQGGVAWPVVKPYWIHMLARARALGLDRGLWPELFAERHFYEPAAGLVASPSASAAP